MKSTSLVPSKHVRLSNTKATSPTPTSPMRARIILYKVNVVSRLLNTPRPKSPNAVSFNALVDYPICNQDVRSSHRRYERVSCTDIGLEIIGWQIYGTCRTWTSYFDSNLTSSCQKIFSDHTNQTRSSNTDLLDCSTELQSCPSRPLYRCSAEPYCEEVFRQQRSNHQRSNHIQTARNK